MPVLEIGAVSIGGFHDWGSLERFLSGLPGNETSRIRRFRRSEDRLRSLASTMLARAMLSVRLGIEGSGISFATDASGKRRVKHGRDVHFNTAHSGEWVLCAVDDLPVGIDVERVVERDLSLAKGLFSEDEWQKFRRKREKDKLSSFYSLWTLKESYVKAVGVGVSLPFDSFTLPVPPDGMEGGRTFAYGGRTFRQYALPPDYIVSVCACRASFPHAPVFTTMVELLSRMAR
jgi:4'-phosphopantetheinyl transferase